MNMNMKMNIFPAIDLYEKKAVRLLRGDYASRMTGYATARQNGWMSANDIRELENMNPIDSADGGDDYLVNGNMMRIASTKGTSSLNGKES